MGNRARAACIFTPLFLTTAAFLLLFLTGIGGFLNEKHGAQGTYEDNGPMTNLWFLRVDFEHLDFTRAPPSQANLTASLLAAAQQHHNSSTLNREYRVFLWDYCQSLDGEHFWCSGRYPGGYFDPVEVWDLDWSLEQGVNGTSPKGTAAADSEQDLGDEALGAAAMKAIDAYRDAARWLTVAYGFAVWSALTTILAGVVALFSSGRWGSFLTWILSLLSSTFIFAAALTSTVLFTALYKSLQQILSPYDIVVTLGGPVIGLTWLAVACSAAASFFWLGAACCCAGASNPHHYRNRRGEEHGTPIFTLDSRLPAHTSGWKHAWGRKGGGGAYVAVQSKGDRGLGISGAEEDEENIPLRRLAQPMARSVSPAPPKYEPMRRQSL